MNCAHRLGLQSHSGPQSLFCPCRPPPGTVPTVWVATLAWPNNLRNSFCTTYRLVAGNLLVDDMFGTHVGVTTYSWRKRSLFKSSQEPNPDPIEVKWFLNSLWCYLTSLLVWRAFAISSLFGFIDNKKKEAKIGIHAILIKRPTHPAAILTNGGQFGINTSSTLSLYSAWVDQYFPSVNWLGRYDEALLRTSLTFAKLLWALTNLEAQNFCPQPYVNASSTVGSCSELLNASHFTRLMNKAIDLPIKNQRLTWVQRGCSVMSTAAFSQLIGFCFIYIYAQSVVSRLIITAWTHRDNPEWTGRSAGAPSPLSPWFAFFYILAKYETLQT